MLNKKALANSLATLAAIIYVVFYILNLIAPSAFEFLFNAQFLGADVADLIPNDFSFKDFLGTLVGAIIMTWVAGYLWGWLYNRYLTK